jgi:uncharacterized membrane protein YdfJ with MMPL/SSD domain
MFGLLYVTRTALYEHGIASDGMHTQMIRWARFVDRRRRYVLGAWLAAVLAASPFAMQQSTHLTGGGFEVPGSQSDAVQDQLERDFDRGRAATLAVVLLPRPAASADDLRRAVGEVQRAAGSVGDVALPPEARERALATVARDGTRPLIVPLQVGVGESDAIDVAVDLDKQLSANGPVGIHLVGQAALWAGLLDLTKEDLLSAEAIGFPLVLLILLGVFGSLTAASLPLALGAASVVVTGALIYLLSLAMDMSVFVTNMASMIGIGVAVDYSLFVLARYREEVAADRSPADARATALSTSGVAVTFSGLTVIVSLAGLFIVNTTSIRSMALGAIIVVSVAVLAAVTLLPALLATVGRRAHARARPERTAPARGFWERWTGAVTRRPVASVVGAGAVLLVLAFPTLDLEMSEGALRQFPADHETRVGAEAAGRLAGPGSATPVQILAPREEASAVTSALRDEPEVARVEPSVASRDGRNVLIEAIPRHDGESDEAYALVERLRATLPSSAEVGGAPAGGRDFLERIEGSMWLIVLFVLALSYVVLLLLLRSVLLPLKAVLMNLLSVGASYGVLVAVFQWGWFDGLLGFESTGSVESLTPPLVLAVVFGLSMDYEVFLLSRIRERWAITGNARTAVAEGLRSSARTITSAALIMVAVFAVFVGTGVPSIKQLGLGCAVAIAVDATLVRLVLVPAAMELLGRWNWWLPRPLERLLPATSP